MRGKAKSGRIWRGRRMAKWAPDARRRSGILAAAQQTPSGEVVSKLAGMGPKGRQCIGPTVRSGWADTLEMSTEGAAHGRG